jgi:hypothetical protein
MNQNHSGYLQTGQATCHNSAGLEIPCPGSGQDAEFRRGIPWPEPRFTEKEDTVLDNLTALEWTKNANFAEFPLNWQEALDFIKVMNEETALGFSDWRLPNRRELRSLVSHQTKNPALPEGHPFRNIFLNWYWTSTTAAINTAYAWHLHMEGARMFYGRKDQFFLVWPVRGSSNLLPLTGQSCCFDIKGTGIDCTNTGQDGELLKGAAWPEPRFTQFDLAARDNLTGICWMTKADLNGVPVSWDGALAGIADLNLSSEIIWRLPTINELESLVDCSSHSPALPRAHPFINVKEAYWSSTTSMFEPDWAYALYLTKGAVGVGKKTGAHFHVWPVCDPETMNSVQPRI